MHRLTRGTIVLATACALLTPAAHAATLQGTACKTLGAAKSQQGVRFKCQKSGKKLLWLRVPAPSRHAAATTTTATPSASATAAPEPSQAPSPSATPTTVPAVGSRAAAAGLRCDSAGAESFPATGPIRCVNDMWMAVDEASDSVATHAFRSLLDRYNSHAEASLPLTFVVEPSAAASSQVLQRSMEAAARLWDVGASPQTPYPVLIGRSLEWFRETSASMQLKSNWGNLDNLANQFTQWGGCSYAEFYSRIGQPWYVYCFSNSADSLQWEAGYLQVGAHEYTHLAQFIMANDFYRQRGDVLAPWAQEGFAQYVGISMGSTAGAGNDVRGLLLRQLQDVTTSLSDYEVAYPRDWSDVYPLGAFACEALVALFGIDVMQRLLEGRASGLTPDATWTAATGRTVHEWTPILAGYVASLRSSKPWTLAELKVHAA